MATDAGEEEVVWSKQPDVNLLLIDDKTLAALHTVLTWALIPNEDVPALEDVDASACKPVLNAVNQMMEHMP